jgi:copper ion binding protein
VTTTFKVPDMTCGHCKATVEKALLDVDGVRTASVDLDTKSVVIDHGDAVTHETLSDAIDAAGYSVATVG